MRESVKRAILIGTICSVSYLGVYIARNILGAVTPQMISSGVSTTESIGTLSSIYFITYAVGQLINGIIGDRISPKYMISLGLILAGISNIVFTLTANNILSAYIACGFTGFFLSMIYAPMVRVVAENTEPVYATRCSLGLTFASFLGSPLAGLLAAVMVWQSVFASSSAILLLMGFLCILIFTVFEKKGIVSYNHIKQQKQSGNGIRVLIRHRIIRFTLISILTGVVRTTVVFWLPTYISQYLGFSTESSALIFTAATFVISLTSFVAVMLYEALGRNMDKTILIGFTSATVCFLAVFFIKQPVLNIIFMVLAIMSSNCASSMMWNRYCPSLRETGMVSTATGYLDFVSYMAASAASSLFANAVADIGWGNLILVWFGLMALGILVALPAKNKL
jgi:sugar phosphate permease